MKILISGGFGLIGSHLIPLLLEKGCEVGVLARRVPGSFGALVPHLDVYVQDLCAATPLKLRRPYDTFIHLAGSPHSVASSDPLTASAAATRLCLELCRTQGIRRFVHFSSFQVYGRDYGPIDEDTPLAPVNEYGRAHQLAEAQVRQAARDGILEHTIIRPTNAFGCPSHPDVYRWSLVPGCFCRSAVDEGEIVLRTSGLQQKDFIYLGRVAGLTYEICRAFDRFRGQPVNLAGGRAQAIVEVAAQVKDEFERLVGRPCTLRALSDEPPRLAPLEVSQARTADLSDEPGWNSTLSAEITKTFSFLTT